jgi:hypothetical protein
MRYVIREAEKDPQVQSDDCVHLKSRQVPSHPCPACGATLDACKGISSDRVGTIPTDGALTVCAYCATLLEFSSCGYVRASRERLSEIPNDLQQVLEATIGTPLRAK